MVNRKVVLDIDVDLHTKIKNYAVKERRSVCNTMLLILELGLEIISNKDKTSVVNVENVITPSVINVDTSVVNSKTMTFNINDVLLKELKEYSIRTESFLKLSMDEKLNKLVSLGFDVLIEMEALEQIKQEVENNNLTIDNEDIVTELPLRVNIKLDQLKKFNDMAKKENLPINKLMSVVLNQYINNYYYVKRKLCVEDIETFRKHAIDKIAIHPNNLFFNNTN
jgi:hypothetical protein